MKRYRVRVIEKLIYTVTVEAESTEEAMKDVEAELENWRDLHVYLGKPDPHASSLEVIDSVEVES